MEVLIFIMALLVSFPGKTNRAIKSLTALLVFPGIWQGHYGNNGPAILLIELALLCNYGFNHRTVYSDYGLGRISPKNFPNM